MEQSMPRMARTEEFRAILDAPEKADRRIALLAFTAVAYNVILAFVNANVMRLSLPVVAGTEMLILLSGLTLVLRAGIRRSDRNVLYFVSAFVIITLFISLLNERVFVDTLRNALIIAIFVFLGRSTNRETVTTTFLWCSLLVLGVLILELSSLTDYAKFLKPADYFLNTRGMAESKYNDTGLFNGALGFNGRFTYGIFSGPRTSSIFLEQVSLANYAAVVCVFLVSLWRYISPKARMIHLLTVVLIVVSNNTRMTSILTVLSLVGYFLYPRVPRYVSVLLVPVSLLLAIGVSLAYPGYYADDFVGRVSVTGQFLMGMGFSELFGMELDNIGHLVDSGYSYVIYSSTVFGLITYWLFISFVVPQNTPERKRCANALALYIFMNLLVSGTAIFSMKTAAPLWLLVGVMSSARVSWPSLSHRVRPRVRS